MRAEERLDSLRAARREEAVRHGANPRDVDLLLSDVLAAPLSWIFAHGETTVDPAPLDALLARRFRGEPLQYIRGRADFFGREFSVDDRVLIPRPETELLVEQALARAPEGARVADIGTGSGCIAVTLAAERPDLHVTGVDISVGALAVAARNRDRHAVTVALAASDLLSATRTRFDVVVSNPPYIPASDIEGLMTEVRDFEPHLALSPGPSGLETIERILAAVDARLVLFEIGFGQEAAVRDAAARQRFRVDEVRGDLAGIPRVVVLSAAS